jgi:hypothetical protein
VQERGPAFSIFGCKGCKRPGHKKNVKSHQTIIPSDNMMPVPICDLKYIRFA